MSSPADKPLTNAERVARSREKNRVFSLHLHIKEETRAKWKELRKRDMRHSSDQAFGLMLDLYEGWIDKYDQTKRDG